MKRRPCPLCVLVTILVLAGSCRYGKIKVIPEISDAVGPDSVYTLNWPEIGSTVFSFGSDLFLIDRSGKLIRFDTATGKTADAIELKKPLGTVFFQQEAVVFLVTQDGGGMLVDLRSRQLLCEWSSLSMERVLGVSARFLVVANKGAVQAFSTADGKGREIARLSVDEILDCELQGDILWILTANKFHRFAMTGGPGRATELRIPACSGFLLDGNDMYYGSPERRLVRVSLARGRIVWQVKLPERLTAKPIRLGRFIVAAPQDNDIFFVTPRGTVYWWEKLAASRLSPPLAMKENVAVFLLNKEVQFFHPGKKKTVNAELDGLPDGIPQRQGDYFYFLVASGKESPRDLVRVGNQFLVNTESDPGPKWLGTSIPFSIVTANLQKPAFEVTIADKDKKPAYTKTLDAEADPSFVWIPAAAGDYSLRIKARALNRTVVYQNTFKVYDRDLMVNQFYFRILEQCPHTIRPLEEDK